MTLGDLEARFTNVSAERTHHRDQQLGTVACREALAAAGMGNYGVGAVLVDPNGYVVEQGRNSVFFPHFRSDLHAEMVVMNAFEERYPAIDTGLHARVFVGTLPHVPRTTLSCRCSNREISGP
jgi:tRNA(Arg) A34 adenosine deaminase TadA